MAQNAMRLSEAIRLGSMATQQAFDDLVSDHGTKACALGAAYIARGDWCITSGNMPAVIITPCAPGWPLLNENYQYQCPMCPRNDSIPTSPEWIVIHLNDWHRWPREQIADWIEYLEEAALRAETSPFEIVDPLETEATVV